jgi:ankyrin repeat protein
LQRRGVDKNAKDKSHRAPLHYAAKKNFVWLVNHLLESGSNPNAFDTKKHTPFSLALLHNFQQTITTIDTWSKHSTDFNV